MKQAIIFDLDGVIVCTDEYHYLAWKQVADSEGIYFDREINERLRGVSRIESLEIILERAAKSYTDEEKLKLADKKNIIYRESLTKLTPEDILPGVIDLLDELKNRSIKAAIGSSSKNTQFILQRIGLMNRFDSIADGNGITKSKPDPEVFLLAARLLKIDPQECAVVEDAYAGIDAAKAAGCKAIAVGSAQNYKKADYSADDISKLGIEELIS
ncbi:MAG: beta-phosphoglucomutase [Bacillota bacterium]|nr:beta-phosphoglucomutase [Bacillota bacterium]